MSTPQPVRPDHSAKSPEPTLRGDRISGERYWSREFMELEWKHMWTRVWQIGGLASEIPEPGDYVSHAIGRDSILMVRQEDGAIKAFFNVCLHRGNRLIYSESGSVSRFTCSYHGWVWNADGSLHHVQDPEDFPQGNPCGRLRLREVACDTWAGFIWFNMDPQCEPLRNSLAPIADQIDAYQAHRWTRVLYLTAEVNCNWKVIQDNFNESYHLPTLHRELNTFIEDTYRDTQFDLYPSGHNRMMMKGGMPALSAQDPNDVQTPLGEILGAWELEAAKFKGRARDSRRALQQAKRKHAAGRGFWHYELLTNDQLTDYHHYTLFPNMSLTMSADGYQLLRPQPHPTDPQKCIFDHWFFIAPVEGIDSAETPCGSRAVADAPHEVFRHGEKSLGFVADQDLSIAVGQQLGLSSGGYQDAYLSGQERRIRRFHELLNDYMAGRR